MINITDTELKDRAKNLKLLVLDVDGVLTEGELTLVGEELEAKRFYIHDGMGLIFLRTAGIKLGIISGRISPMVRRRAAELNIDEVCEGFFYKQEGMESLTEKLGLSLDQTAYVGDDLHDIPAMKIVGLPISVANARPEVKDYSIYVSTSRGGHGAVREICEWLLELRDEKQEIFDHFMLTTQEKESRALENIQPSVLPTYSKTSQTN